MAADEVHPLAKAILDAARVARLDLTEGSGEEPPPLRHVHVLGSAARLLGYEPEELDGLASSAIFAQDERMRVDALADSWSRCEALDVPTETVAIHRCGARVPVEVTVSAVPLHDAPSLLMLVSDLRRRSPRPDTARAETRVDALLDAAPQPIAVHRDGRVVYANAAHLDLFDRRAEELVGLDTTAFVHPDDQEVLKSRLTVTGETTVGARLSYRIVRPDGGIVDAELTTVDVEFRGEPAVVGFSRDVSECARMLAKFAFTDRMATLGKLTAGVVHEVNDPLTYATLNLELLGKQATNCDETVRTTIAAVREGLTRVMSIVRDLRGFSLPTIEPRWPVDTQVILESAVNVAMLTFRGRARITRSYAEVPPLKTDPARLGQVLLNLLVNAVQSFEGNDESENELLLSISLSPEREIVVAVCDNGAGIPAENLPRIFEPFFTTKEAGVGLGLALCRMLVASFGARLEVESTVGVGSCFSIHLPLPKQP